MAEIEAIERNEVASKIAEKALDKEDKFGSLDNESQPDMYMKDSVSELPSFNPNPKHRNAKKIAEKRLAIPLHKLHFREMHFSYHPTTIKYEFV